MKSSTVRAILTDSHFWVPVVVLAFGIALLVVIR
ncbi:MAG: translocated intimin receptor Tir [Acidobacteriia bacterium]|nr:translocated intimin receptor Tir [Terriglobia bacterium]